MPEVEPRFKEPKQPKDIPAKTRALIKRRSGGMCEKPLDGVCWGRAAHIHHISRRSQGRDHSPENLIHLCTPCHDHVHKNVGWAKEHGYLA